MLSFIFEKQWIKQTLLCCLFVTHLLPTTSHPLLHAQEEEISSPCNPCCSPTFIEQEDRQQRCRLAAAAAGATIAGLTAGIIYVVAFTGGRRHCSSSSSSSCYSNYSSCYSGYSNSCCDYSNSCYSGSGCSGSRRHHHHHHHHRTGYPEGSLWNFAEIPPGNENRSKVNPSPSSSLSGLFSPSFSFPEQAKGSFSIFLQSPDGRTHVLGHVSLAYPQHSSFTFGPFTQSGLYTFGVRIEEEIEAPAQIQAGRFELHLNGSSIESYEFVLPSHASIGYEPPPATFKLS